MERVKKLKVVEEAGRNLLHIGSKEHMVPAKVITVHPALIQEDYCVYFPLKAQYDEELQAFIPSDEAKIFVVEVEAGYRGSSTLEVLSPARKVIYYPLYASERGNLGVGQGAIVETTDDVVVYAYERRGRLYGAPPRGVVIITQDTEYRYEGLNPALLKKQIEAGLVELPVKIDLSVLDQNNET